jgi:hypothetical protein
MSIHSRTMVTAGCMPVICVDPSYDLGLIFLAVSQTIDTTYFPNRAWPDMLAICVDP